MGRFDVKEPDARRGRFDQRRSRSPFGRGSESRRSRSPIGRASAERDGSGATAASAEAATKAALAAAAKINASVTMKKGPTPSDVAAIRSSSMMTGADASSNQSPARPGEVYQQDGDFIKDIEVNDLRNRYTLTKGATQKQIKDETGADVTTRGSYYPDKSMATSANPPLYLHVTSQTKEGLEKAIAKIDELMQVDLPNLVDERRFRRREQPEVERDERGRRKWPEERIPIDLEPIPGFNLRAQVVGQGGQYVKHIQAETQCKVQIKGRGSGFYEAATGVESEEPMYLHVTGPQQEQVEKARELCEDLLGNVREQYQEFKSRPPRGAGGGGYGRNGSNGGGNPYGGHGSPPGAGAAMSPVPQGQSAGYGAPQPTADGSDPYAAYGGYEAYMQYYYYYFYTQQAQQGQPGAEQGAPGQSYGSPPPPPPDDYSQPPPPPPPGAAPGTGSYSNVPPPPGL